MEDDQIQQLTVLEYRESRGAEIRHDFFTRQFNHVGLTSKLKLNQSIDGITGATMSVRSAKRVAAAALYLHEQVLVSQIKSSRSVSGEECH